MAIDLTEFAVTVAAAEPAAPDHPAPSPRRAGALIAVAWLPAVIVAAFLPRYVPVFDSWRAQWGELPPLTHALVAAGRLGAWPLALAGAGVAAVLAGGGAGWVRAGLPGRRPVVAALAVTGLVAFAVILAGTLGQVITAPVVPVR